MPKHKRNPLRHNVELSPRVPHTVQNRRLRDENAQLRMRFNKMNRLLWVAIHQANGRIEMAASDYEMAMQMPDSDCGVAVEVDERDPKKKKVVLILVDETGKRLPESEPKLIIEA